MILFLVRWKSLINKHHILIHIGGPYEIYVARLPPEASVTFLLSSTLMSLRKISITHVICIFYDCILQARNLSILLCILRPITMGGVGKVLGSSTLYFEST